MSWRSHVARYAIYYAPRPGTPLARFGRGWLGRDPEARPEAVPAGERVRIAGLPPDRHDAWTASPRRYGFHLTLKPPFRLRPGRDLEALQASVAAYAATRPVVQLPTLRLGVVADCLSLVPSGAFAAAITLAAACVADFDRFRAPAEAEEVEARRAEGLSPPQEALLARWGFPYVMDEARISLTLTDPLAATECAWLAQRLESFVSPSCREPVPIEDLCLYAQPAGATDFSLVGRYPLGHAVIG
jgi:hypothetical protein